MDPKDYVTVPINATVFAGEVVYDREGTTSSARPVAAHAHGHDDHGLRCYEGGACCCVLTDRIRAGQP